MWFIGVEVEQETSAPPPEKNPGSASVFLLVSKIKTIERLAVQVCRPSGPQTMHFNNYGRMKQKKNH